MDIVAEIAKSILLLGLGRKMFYLEKTMRYMEDVFTHMCGLFQKWNSKNRKNLCAEEKNYPEKRRGVGADGLPLRQQRLGLEYTKTIPK